MCNRNNMLAWSHHLWTSCFYRPKKCSFILTASHSLDKSCMAELSTLGFYICVFPPRSYPLVFLFWPSFCFWHYCALLVDSRLKWITAYLLGLVNTILWFIKCILIVKCHLKLKVHTHPFMCVPYYSKSTQLTAEIFLYLNSKSRCRLNIKNMYYYKTHCWI